MDPHRAVLRNDDGTFAVIWVEFDNLETEEQARALALHMDREDAEAEGFYFEMDEAALDS